MAATLLAIGGLNWGRVGLFDVDVDLVATLFGGVRIMLTAVSALVGLAVVDQVAGRRGYRSGGPDGHGWRRPGE